MNESQKEIYQRNLLTEGFSEEAQQRLLDSRVCVVGAGGLGSAVLNYLTAAGVGTITIVENDVVSVSNLQRQILYTTPDVGRAKAEVAAMRLSALNPACRIGIVVQRLDAQNADSILSGYDIIVDCTDNYATRYVIDDFCGANTIPMIYGTAQEMRGQVSVFHYGGAGSYRSLYPEIPEQKPVVGVLSPIVGVIGSLQALEAIKILAGIGEPLAGRLLTVDGGSMIFSEFALT